MSTEAISPATHEGMGAVLYEEGVAFRVWAPHADAVHVAGTFNDWSPDATPLAPEDNGYWSADVSEAGVGDEYHYIITNGDQNLERNDPYARVLTHSSGNSIVYDPNAFEWGEDGADMPPWNEVVIYEMHIGTFAGHEDEPGTLHDAIERLDYLRDLGVNAVEIMPLAEFSGDYSWGYNPAFPFAVEQAYGGPDAFKTFVKEAHQRGIAVILDVVYNHFGPGDLDLWQFDGWSENDKGGIYFYNDHRSSTPWGDTRPDYGREEVRQYIVDNVQMWLDEYHVDGLRMDMTPYIYTNDGGEERIEEGWTLMQRINGLVQDQYPGRLIIAEDLHSNETITRPTEEEGAGFGAQWDAAFVHPVRETITAADDDHRSLDTVRDALTHRFGDDVFARVIYTESHDEVANGSARVPEEVWPENGESWPAEKRSTLGAALVCTAPGIPMLFQGQELLETGWFDDNEPIDWSRLDEREGIRNLYRDLIALRRNMHGKTRGLTGQHIDVYHADHEGQVLAYHRWAEGGAGDSTIVVINMSDQTFEDYALNFPAPGMWHVRFNSDWEGYADDFGNQATYDVEADEDVNSALLTIGPYSAVILSQDPE